MIPIKDYNPTTRFAVVTAALIALARGQDVSGWWSPRVTWIVLALVGVTLIGCRTDLLVALGVGFAVRWWQRRGRSDLVAAGERIGYIKFGSRVDVLFGTEWRPTVKIGDRVSAGTTLGPLKMS